MQRNPSCDLAEDGDVIGHPFAHDEALATHLITECNHEKREDAPLRSALTVISRNIGPQDQVSEKAEAR